MRRLSWVLFLLLAISLEARQQPLMKTIQGRWKIDVAAATEALHRLPQYANGDEATRQKIDGAILPVLPLLTIEITADSVMGMNGTQPYEVRSASGRKIVLHLKEPAPGSELAIEVIDRDTIRAANGSDDILPMLLHRDLEYEARLALRPATPAQREAWLRQMNGVWRVDLETPILENMRASEAWRAATPDEREREEKIAQAVFATSDLDLVEFTADSMRGVAAASQKEPHRQPASFELTAIDGRSAYATVIESNEIRREWKFEQRPDGSVRVSDHGQVMFDLHREKSE